LRNVGRNSRRGQPPIRISETVETAKEICNIKFKSSICHLSQEMKMSSKWGYGSDAFVREKDDPRLGKKDKATDCLFTNLFKHLLPKIS
jgi:hypothetical protein